MYPISPVQGVARVLETEAACHGDSIILLSDRVEKVRSHLAEWNDLHEKYQESAKKVENAASRLQFKEKDNAPRAGSRRLSTTSTTMLRQELDKATNTMNIALQRVEQIETVTDTLIRQLTDTEAELAAVQARREEESTAHAEEVDRLMTERMQLQNDLNAAVIRASEVEAQEEDLKLELEAATLLAEELACEVAAADRAKTQAETRLTSEKDSLDATLADLRAREAQLTMQLVEKEGELAEAVERAAQGTPVGRGAKIVLPMALRRLKETEQALRVQETSKQTVVAQLAEVAVHGAAREAALKLQLQNLEAQKDHEVAEKQASFDSMRRTVTLAATEAFRTQEAVLKLVAEVTALDTERNELRDELQDATHKYLELEAQLSETQNELTHACAEKEQAYAAVAALREQLTSAADAKETLAATLDANREHSLALEFTINSMREHMESNGAGYAEKVDALQSAVAAAKANAANTKLHLAEAMDAQASLIKTNADLEITLSQQEASVADLTRAVIAAQGKAADLSAQLFASADAAAAQKFEMMRATEAVQTQYGEVLREREVLQNQVIQKARTVDALEDSVAELRSGLATAQNKHAASLQDMQEVAAAAEARLAVTMDQLAAAADSQDSLLSINSQLEDSIQSLRTRVNSVCDENSALRDALEATKLDNAVTVQQLQTQLKAAAHAQGSVLAINTQLEESIRSLHARINSLSGDKLDAEKALRAAHEDKSVAIQQLQAQINIAADAQVSLRATNAQLEESVRSLYERLIVVTEQKCYVEDVLETTQQDNAIAVDQLRAQLQVALAAQDSLCAANNELKSSVSGLQDRLDVICKEKSAVEGAQHDTALAMGELQTKLQAAIDAQATLGYNNFQLEDSVRNLQQRLNFVIEEKFNVEDALETAQNDKSIAVAQLQAQLQAASEAQVSLCSTNAQLEESLRTLENRLRSVSEDKAAVEDAFEDVQQKNGATIQQLYAQLQVAADAQDSLKLVNAQLEDSVQSLHSRITFILEEKSVVEGALESAHYENALAREQLQAATEAQAALIEQRAQLEQRLTMQEACVDEITMALGSLADEAASKEEELNTLATRATERAEALSAQLQKVCEERDNIDRNRTELASQLVCMAEALRAKEIELATLQEQGGASKQVLELSFSKIRDLQKTVADTQTALDAKIAVVSERDATIAKLQQAACQREELAAALKHRLEIATEAAEAQAADFARQLQSEREARENVEKVNAELAPQVQALVAELEAAAEAQTEAEASKLCVNALYEDLSAQLEAAMTERDAVISEKVAASAILRALVLEKDAAVTAAENIAAELRAELALVRSSTDNKENSNKEAMQQTFDKVRELEATLAAKATEISHLKDQIQNAETYGATLGTELATTSKALATANKDNEALERAMCRLRVDVQVELEARQQAQQEFSEAKEEIFRLEISISELHAEAAELRETLAQRSQMAEEYEARLNKAATENQDLRAARTAMASSLLSTQTALAATEFKVANLLTTLESVRAESVKKEVAAEEASARALEKISVLQAAVEARDGRLMELSAELDVAQSLLAEAAAEAAAVVEAKEALKEECDIKDQALAEIKVAKNAVVNKVAVSCHAGIAG